MLSNKKQLILKNYADTYYANKGKVRWSDLQYSRSTIRSYFSTLIDLKQEAKKLFSKKFKNIKALLSYEEQKEQNIQTYIDLYNKNNIDLRGLAQASGVDKATIKNRFGGIKKLDQLAREKYPDKFNDIALKSILTPKKIDVLKQSLKMKKFVITTAVLGCKADINFLASIKTYCKQNNAELLLLVCADPASANNWVVDAALKDEHFIIQDTRLNSNLFLSNIKLSAKQINPITGLNRIGQRNGSFIFASPKQFLTLVPVSNIGLPHALMTTGAITKSRYKPVGKRPQDRQYLSERTAYIADHDHTIGGIIVEIEDDKIFHFRQIQADTKGHFIDFGIEYSPNGVKQYNPKVIVLGDYHSGQTDPIALNGSLQMIDKLRPQIIVLHDSFDGLSINHHEIGNTIVRAQRALHDQLSLENELTKYALDLEYLATKCEQIIEVRSNHHDFLDKYLNAGFYIKDPQNHLLALKLAIQLISGNNPLKWYIEEIAKIKNSKKIKWLSRDEDYKIAGIQVGGHGDQGANGGKGSLANSEASYGSCVTGHFHSPAIIRQAWQVGTLSLLRMNYNKGPSNWFHSNCLIYPNGMRQLINIIGGKWKL